MGFPRDFSYFFLQTDKVSNNDKIKKEAVLTLLYENSITYMFKGRDQPVVTV